jgi:hypothetical protein
MALHCIQCGEFKFSDKKEEVPPVKDENGNITSQGTYTGRCNACNLINIYDDSFEMLGYVKHINHNKSDYTFYSFKPADYSVLVLQYNSGNQKIIDKFPRYMPIDLTAQKHLIELIDYVNNNDKLLELPKI